MASEVIAAIAAVASAFAAGLSAWSAISAPRKQKHMEERRLKLHVFATLMQERVTIASLDSVRALNILDVVFADAPKVRDAWAELYGTFENAGPTGPHLQIRDDKMNALLREMALDLGLSRSIKSADFSRRYFPNSIAKQEEIKMLQQDADLQRLKSQLGSTGTDTDIQKKFPPRPSG